VASLILPADSAWGACEEIGARQELRPLPVPAESVVDGIARLMKGGGYEPGSVALLLGGRAMWGDAPQLAGQIAAKTGCKLFGETKNARSARGTGRVNIPQIPYPIAGAMETLKDIRLLILVGAREPVAFFGYPDLPRFLVSDDCRVETLAEHHEDMDHALQALSDAVGGCADHVAYLSNETDRPGWKDESAPTSLDMGRALAALMPEGTIVVDEAITSGRQLQSSAAMALPHDWLEITGGAIGYGLPCAIGAAIGCPDRKVVAIIGDGTAMYTVQALWTMARENLDITVIICANRKYQILRGELAAMGGPPPAANALRMLTLDTPHLDWVSLARGMGVSGTRVDNMGGLAKALNAGLSSSGPSLIEVLI
jgi:acetolactate synthase-1/2/3 large subunit